MCRSQFRDFIRDFYSLTNRVFYNGKIESIPGGLVFLTKSLTNRVFYNVKKLLNFFRVRRLCLTSCAVRDVAMFFRGFYSLTNRVFYNGKIEEIPGDLFF